MLFPTAQFFLAEEFGMVAAVGWIMASECGLIDLLAYPPLLRFNWRPAVRAFVWGIDDHFRNSWLIRRDRRDGSNGAKVNVLSRVRHEF
jgi:hypothetical protein